MKAVRDACVLAAAVLAAASAGCDDKSYDVDSGDGGTDTGDTETTDTETDTGTDTGTEIADAGDTDPGVAAPGEPCWKESFGDSHPNAGLPDCGPGYVCVGDATGAWCSEICDETGAVDASGGAFDGWCCGEFSNPCEPWHFWVPTQLAKLCIPRTAGLNETCVETGTWPSSDVRCAPRCTGTTLVSETICETEVEAPFCTFACDPAASQCELEDAFVGGCCLQYGVTYLCTPADLCP
jgi:hypothetical protein